MPQSRQKASIFSTHFTLCTVCSLDVNTGQDLLGELGGLLADIIYTTLEYGFQLTYGARHFQGAY